MDLSLTRVSTVRRAPAIPLRTHPEGLVQQCTTFARSAGYKRIVLWTNSVLTSARRIYEQEGYRLLREKPYTAFGKDLVSQDWQLDL